MCPTRWGRGLVRAGRRRPVRPGRRGEAAARERHDAAGVAIVDEHVERLGECGPHLFAVEGVADGAHQVLAGEVLPEVRRHGVFVQGVDQLDDLLTGRAGVLPERAGQLLGARVEIVVQRGLLALGAHQPLFGQRLGEGVHPVEDHPAHLLGELRRVHRAQPRPVGEAEVVELLVAEGGAHHVQVPGGVERADVRQHRPGVLLARRGGPPQLFERGLGVVRVLAVVGRLQGLVGAVAAADGGGAADAARIEGDEVVAVREVHELLASVGEFGDARAAGAAEVQQQRTARVAGGPVAGHGQVEGSGLGPGVVERHGDLAAPQVLGHLHALALRPLDLLLVEAGQVGLLVVLLGIGARRRGRQPGPQQGQHRDRGSGERTPSVRGPHACLQGDPARAAGDDLRITISGPSRPRLPAGGSAGSAVSCAAPAPYDGPRVSPVRVNSAARKARCPADVGCSRRRGRDRLRRGWPRGCGRPPHPRGTAVTHPRP